MGAKTRCTTPPPDGIRLPLTKFNTYRFADYKDTVIDLIGRVTRVSIETMEIVEAMKFARREKKEGRVQT